jgi:hypothetical protein
LFRFEPKFIFVCFEDTLDGKAGTTGKPQRKMIIAQNIVMESGFYNDAVLISWIFFAANFLFNIQAS